VRRRYGQHGTGRVRRHRVSGQPVQGRDRAGDVVRIIDVAFVKKDADGTVTMFEYDTLDDVLAFGFADIDGEAGGVLNDEDLELAAEALEPDSSAALIVWEHRWAARVAQAIRDAGGRIVAGERVPDEIVEQALADLASG
jgi:hypothetical protein